MVRHHPGITHQIIDSSEGQNPFDVKSSAQGAECPMPNIKMSIDLTDTLSPPHRCRPC